MNNNSDKTALAIMAHPDDAEFICAGTLTLLRKRNWNIEIASMTAGDCGSREYGRKQISSIRKKEAATAAKLLDANYTCLDCDDIFLTYDKPTILRTIALVRRVKPKVVFTMSPSCYMIDHEVTSQLAQTACFSCGIVNIDIENTDPYFHIPHLYYADAMEGKDKFGKEIKPTTIVNINSVINIKEKMLMSHRSQQSWLRAHNGMDQYLQNMKELSEKRGVQISTAYAEGFRQHLGHAFPQGNILKSELNGLVFEFRNG